MKRYRKSGANILGTFLAISLLLALVACSSRVDDRQRGHPDAPFQAMETEAGSASQALESDDLSETPELEMKPPPDTGAHSLPGAGDESPALERPLATSEPRLGGSQYGRIHSSESQSKERVCGWEITFEDHFSGGGIDTGRWNTAYKAGDKESQYYVEDAFELEDGILKIRAEERQVDDRDYASGILTTQGKFEQQYGRFVVRARVPAGQGLWPAFWLMPSSGGWPPEIDVFEILGHDTRRVYMSHRWVDGSGEHAFDTRGFSGPDFSQDFHDFEVEWTPEELVWRVDGKERSRQNRGVPHEPIFLLLNLAVGGEWPGYPDESTPFPSYLEVDYVQAYTWTCPEGIGDEFESEGVQTD